MTPARRQRTEETITIHPTPPFDFALSAAIFARGDPGFRHAHGGVFRHALLIGSCPVVVEARSAGTTDNPALEVTVASDNGVTARIRDQAAATVAGIFSTGDDPAPFYRAMEDDPVMADLTRQLRGLRAPATPTVFEALADSVIEQQISLVAARAVEHRLIHATGTKVTAGGRTFSCYPTPAILAAVPDTVFRACGLTVRKGEYLRGIAEAILAGSFDPEAFRSEPDTETIISGMVKIRGIGRWTAELMILRGLHRPDVFPADDVGVRRFISRYYLGGEKIAPADARTFAERWGAWKGFAAYYLEVADLLGIRPGSMDESPAPQ